MVIFWAGITALAATVNASALAQVFPVVRSRSSSDSAQARLADILARILGKQMEANLASQSSSRIGRATGSMIAADSVTPALRLMATRSSWRPSPTR